MKTFMIGIASLLLSAGVAFADCGGCEGGGCDDAAKTEEKAEAGCEGESGCDDAAKTEEKAEAGCESSGGGCGGCAMATAGNPTFDRLKTLEGEWTGSMGKGEDKAEFHVTYRVTSGGTALIETMFPGTEKEMVTVYHVDGETLMLTHFCLGNQPRMKLAKTEGDSLHFEFVDGTNCEAGKVYMGGLVLTMDGPTLRHEWSMMKDGEAVKQIKFEMTRAKTSK